MSDFTHPTPELSALADHTCTMQHATQPNSTLLSGVCCRVPTFHPADLTTRHEFRFQLQQPCQRPLHRFFMSTSCCKVCYETQHLPTPCDLQQPYTSSGLVGRVLSKYYPPKQTNRQHGIHTSIHVHKNHIVRQLAHPENSLKSSMPHTQISSLKQNPPLHPTNHQFTECTLTIRIIQDVLIIAGPLAIERTKSLLHGDQRRCPFRRTQFCSVVR
jgi:hypothetical protein